MVCAKCQKALKTTELATPGVKRKSEMYYGSPASKGAGDKNKTSSTLGNNGIGKVGGGAPFLSVETQSSSLTIFEFMCDVQDEDGARKEILSEVCL
ncbi:MAG: hypothetical protein M1812_006616 [Candelaria pacifica]|nr:MAG: hypothetical protein M1812_006616 [Candelaria pacifica]